MNLVRIVSICVLIALGFGSAAIILGGAPTAHAATTP